MKSTPKKLQARPGKGRMIKKAITPYLTIFNFLHNFQLPIIYIKIQDRKEKKNTTVPPMSEIFKFSRKTILAIIEAITGVVKFNTTA